MSHFDSLAQRRLPSPDARILSWSGDHTLRLWDVAAGQTIGSAMKHDDAVYGAMLT
jgi:WD40 repeat protein